jgi:hypothetical protein
MITAFKIPMLSRSALAPIANVKLVTTAPATQQPREQPLPLAHRRDCLVAHEVAAIVAKGLSIALILVPVNITFVVIANEHLCLLRRLSRPSLTLHGLAASTTVSIGRRP